MTRSASSRPCAKPWPTVFAARPWATCRIGEKLQATGRGLGIEVENRAGGAKGAFIPTGLRWVVECSFAWLSRYHRLNTIIDCCLRASRT